MTLPSKELLSEVLEKYLEGGKINKYYLIKDERHLLRLILSDKTDCWSYDINIYELSHKCKEWANSKGYDVLQCVLTDGKSWVQLCEYNNMELRNKLSHYIHGNCEVEAIIKMCEYIMEQTNAN